MMNPSERIEYVQELLRTQQFEEALPVYIEVYEYMALSIAQDAARRNFLIPIPGEPYMDLYFGHSKYLNAYKIGISKDAERREKEIRATNARFNAGDDFELWDFIQGPAQAVRAAEKRIKSAYAHAMVMGQEWISGVAEDASDAYWVERDWVFEEWENQLRRFDPRQQLERERELAQFITGSRTVIGDINAIGQKIKEWHKHRGAMERYFSQQPKSGRP